MSNKKQDIIIFVTLGVIILLVLGSMILDFKIYDIVYLAAIIICILRYKLVKNM